MQTTENLADILDLEPIEVNLFRGISPNDGFPRIFGHRNGARAFRETVEEAGRLGVEAMTFYSFSLENWRRPADEVQALMLLCIAYCEGEREARDGEAGVNGIRYARYAISRRRKRYAAG